MKHKTSKSNMYYVWDEKFLKVYRGTFGEFKTNDNLPKEINKLKQENMYLAQLIVDLSVENHSLINKLKDY